MLVRPAIKFCWNCYNWPDEILCNIFLPESSILSLAATAFLLSLWPLLQYCIIFPPAEDLQAFYIFYSIFNLKNFSLGSAAAPGEITGGLYCLHGCWGSIRVFCFLSVQTWTYHSSLLFGGKPDGESSVLQPQP